MINFLIGNNEKSKTLEYVEKLMAERNIDGGLIGGAALKANDFAGIVNYKD